MIPSEWSNRRNRQDARYPNAGDDVLTELGDLVAAFHVESSLWPDARSLLIWEQAWTLDRVRIDIARGAITIEHGRDWIAAGIHLLNETRSERYDLAHPKRRRRNGQ